MSNQLNMTNYSPLSPPKLLEDSDDAVQIIQSKTKNKSAKNFQISSKINNLSITVLDNNNKINSKIYNY